MPTLRLFGARRVTSRAPQRIEPAVGPMNPAMSRRSFVLPQPEGPRRKKSLPPSIESDTSSTARVFPNHLDSPTRSIGMLIAARIVGVAPRIGRAETGDENRA